MRSDRALRTAVMLFAVTAAAGCGGGSDGPTQVPGPAVSRVVVTPEHATVLVGRSVTLTAVAQTRGGVAADEAITWSSSDASVATVDAGVVTAVSAGTATIRATARGVVGSASITVQPVSVASVSLSPMNDTVFVGITRQLTATARDSAGATLTGRTFAWSSSDTVVARISAAGLVTARGAGVATITAAAGSATGTMQLRVRTNPVRPTSYENFKETGVEPFDAPQRSETRYDQDARGYGDFFGRGVPGDLFTAKIIYRLDQPIAQAPGAEYTFWRRQGDRFVADNSILVPPTSTCLHPRKAVVADLNMDGRPDIFLACHGYDAPPFPGELSQVILSQPDGRYVVRNATSQGFWHGAAAADLNGDGYPDVIAVNNFDPERAIVFLNNRDGTFTREAPGRLPALGSGNYFTVELADVNEDGRVDLLLGGHEWENAPTRVLLNPGDGQFGNATSVTIPAVANEGVVLDFILTGTGPTRTLWALRSSGGDGTFYASVVVQRFDWATRTSTVAVNRRPAVWAPWLIRYSRNGQMYIGSDDLGRSLEVLIR